MNWAARTPRSSTLRGGNIEQRMNGICAGGTGSFIDQMASLLQTDATGLNEYAKNYKAIYPIAARCGVFAKTDIQPLINDGATKEDLAVSIFQAVVNQTISGLACGKPIRGHIAFLGGPLHFLSELRQAFIRTLKLDEEHSIMPDNSHLFAAIGSAMNASLENSVSLKALAEKLRSGVAIDFEVARMEPLFASQEEYDAFLERQSVNNVATAGFLHLRGQLLSGHRRRFHHHQSGRGGRGRLPAVFFLQQQPGQPPGHFPSGPSRRFTSRCRIPPTSPYSCSTGYGEALIKAALMLDEGEVETIGPLHRRRFL